MESKKRRRLYEGFEMLEKSQDNPEIIMGRSQDNPENLSSVKTLSQDNPEINLHIDIVKSQDNPKKIFGWFEFSKLQQNILIYIHKNCVFNASLMTTPIRVSEMEESLRTTPSSIRKTIYNLIKMQALKRESFKDGPGGWSKFILPKEVYDLISIEAEKSKNLKKILGLSHDNLMTKHEKTDLSSSNKINILNTNTESDQFLIPENLKSIGIGNKQLMNILNLNILPAEEIQNSLDHYSFDISNSVRPNLNLFFGILRKGSNYISQKYTMSLQSEIEAEIKRIEEAKQLQKNIKENELYLKYQDFKKHNTQWFNDLKLKQRFQVSEEIFENLAFQEFKNLNN